MKSAIKFAGLAAMIAGLTGLSAQTFAASPYGDWKRPKTGATIEVMTCRGGLGMKVVKSKDRKSIGKVIMCGATKSGANMWKGNITSTEDGNTYSGYVKLTGSSLKLSGCVLGGLICKDEIWRRAN